MLYENRHAQCPAHRQVAVKIWPADYIHKTRLAMARHVDGAGVYEDAEGESREEVLNDIEKTKSKAYCIFKVYV